MASAGAPARATDRPDRSRAGRSDASAAGAAGEDLDPPRRLSPLQREELALAFVLTVCVSLFPRWRVFEQLWARDVLGLKTLPWVWYVGILFVLVGLILAGSAPRRSGLSIGTIRRHWKKVLLVCGGSVLVAAVVYPQLPVRPFADRSAAMWVLSPTAQELLFLGYIYGRLERAFPGHLHPRLPVARALVLTSMFFALWHVPNLVTMPVGYVVFQLFYTGALGIIPGLSRQWTGSILYVILTHSAINFIAWYAS